MRILHVVKKFPNLIGGDATAVDGLARAQMRAGYDVTVVTSNAAPVRRAANVVRVGPAQRPEDLDRIGLNRLRAMWALRRWARSQVPQIRPDVIHAHSADLGFAASPVSREAGVPIILTCHGLWFPVWGARSPRGRAELYLLRHGQYGAIATVDRAARDALRKRGFPYVVHVPNGVDPDEFAGPREVTDRVRFVFAGRHEAQKGLDVLLEAVSILRAGEAEPFDVLLLGSGSLTEALRERVHTSGLGAHVRFLGAVDRSTLVRTFQQATVFVLPSRFEGFPVAILEAWAAGLPVIATSVGGIPEVCSTDNALLVPPGDPTALASAMASLLRDPTLRERLGTAGRALLRERFTWTVVATRYEELYAEAAARIRDSSRNVK